MKKYNMLLHKIAVRNRRVNIDEKTRKERKQLAIERAARNLNQFHHNSPAKAESSTTVFKLVEEIVKNI